MMISVDDIEASVAALHSGSPLLKGCKRICALVCGADLKGAVA